MKINGFADTGKTKPISNPGLYCPEASGGFVLEVPTAQKVVKCSWLLGGFRVK